jgi:hypothetical protein
VVRKAAVVFRQALRVRGKEFLGVGFGYFMVACQSSESGRWASPVFFGPGTLVRTWGTRRFPLRLL